jgi:Ca2+-binding RTX toxin-like protein
VLNGGDGEDDIIGGSSDLSVPLVADRPDGTDLIDGGAGHDVIAGDNARITRRLNTATNTFFRYTPGTPSGTGVGPENNAVIRDFTLLDLDTIGGNDTATGGAGDDIILGGLGDDNLAGNDGNDQLIGHLGADRLDGGNGHDALLGDKGTIVVDLLDGATARTIADSGHRLVALVDGQGYLKRLVVLEQPDIGGDDTLLGGAGDDVLHGGAGNDQMSGDAGDDALFGDVGNDNVNGGAGQDNLFGGGGDDALDGGADADIIYGGDGQDTLTADIAADKLVDWFGNFNLFIVPGPGFGAPTIIRSSDPSTQQFLLDLATGDGAIDADGEIQVVQPPSPSNAGK